ncbi:double-strand break repair protein AddB [Methylovirgula sp. 4M-Z18]|uniref:double-strand break repair protein AddB n=1 Tax=Methylovirgula sp. 4M-Z18 TaxID=2293567 RepID=UPI000E2FDF63|nr:double-strand break repair protein AddB [Methylovirgula sp. 4M-Z18]RFB79020.1 double-strand break repair protein AddB [Methylovirgula sp. 4M-Z18]
MSAPRVVTIAPGAKFLDVLVDHLLDGSLVPGFSAALGPLALSDVTIFVPTQRAARALAQVFSARFPGPSCILPRILPLGALDGDASGLFAGEPGFDPLLDEDLPQAIPDIERRMILARLILQWGRAVQNAIVSIDAQGRSTHHADEAMLVATTPADAWALSRDLAGLIDELIIEGVAWSDIKPFGVERYDDYWRITLDFLNIAMTQWPDILASRHRVDAATRRARLIEREIARLQSTPPRGPIIAAGSTGTNQATARLLAAIARAPQGAVVLPGLDKTLDDAAWHILSGGEHAEPASSHPQAVLSRLVATLGLTRAEIAEVGMVPSSLARRTRLISEALRPAESTEHWLRFVQGHDEHYMREALQDLALIEALDEREEVLAIALALREALETPGRTAALVTPDRNLARRVQSELRRWQIDVEPSGGEPLDRSCAGTFARLVMTYVVTPEDSANLLALLKYPAARLGLPREELDRLSEILEAGVLRVLLPGSDMGDVAALLDAAREAADDPHAHPLQQRITESDWTELLDLLTRFTAIVAPLMRLDDAPLAQWLDAHRATIIALTEDNEHGGLQDASAETLAKVFDALQAAAEHGMSFGATDYLAFFSSVLAEQLVQIHRPSHPRLKILGLLEARLLSVDLAVLGGLDETIWPPQAETDAFLNRPMRAALGLTPPERRIGQTAHDFTVACGHPHVILTRALKRDGAPTVASRFLQRLGALAGAHWEACKSAGENYLRLARLIDRAEMQIVLKPPKPRPSVSLRPQRLSVTQIERLRRDPYSIYAERILRLTPLGELNQVEGPSEIGAVLHDALNDLVRKYPTGATPAAALADMKKKVGEDFARLLLDPDFRAFRWPDIVTALQDIFAWDAGRRVGSARFVAEESGALPLTLLDGSLFKLTARADRFEIGSDEAVTIVDFKTGAVPSSREIYAGFAPQLTLEAAMVAQNAFAHLPPNPKVADALYVKFLGIDEIKPKSVTEKPRAEAQEKSIADLAADHLQGLRQLLDQFRQEDTAYVSRPFPQFVMRFGVYDHLARVKEWSATGGALDGAEGES